MRLLILGLLCMAIVGCATPTKVVCSYPPIPAELMQQRVPFMSIESFVAVQPK